MKFYTNKWITAGLLTVITVSLVQADLLSSIGKMIKPENILKTGGVILILNQFGGKINDAMNGLTKHKDTEKSLTKVVPILSVALIGSDDNAIGAAQVMGPKSQIEKVQAVAQPEAKLLGTVRIRALIPVSSKDVTNIRRVDNVSITGIVDIKL